ncbi:MAG TPA: hypothetical protein PLD54_01215 [Candidatus Levybacteria bacterium]|nr:hypothetical protein [Candidatus Levybacteria bacterium]
MERVPISQEAYQSYIRPLPTSEELEQSGIINLSEQMEQRREIPSGRKVVQYELDFDREQACKLLQTRGQEDFESRVENFKSFTEMQLVTALGERFNRGLSRYSYRSIDGVLYGEHSDEPFLDVLERGRAYREINGNPTDFARERAEVVGFEKIQEYMKHAEPGTTAISVSQPGGKGSIYKHNFYDGFQKRADGKIEVVRFSNAHNAQETIQRLIELNPDIIIPDDLSPEYLLANPIIVSSGDFPRTLDEIHAYIHTDHDVIDEEDFAVVREMCAFLIVSYMNSLLNDPEDFDTHARLFNAFFNKADEIIDALKVNKLAYVQSSSDMTIDQMYYLGEQEVRQVDTGCGFSGGVMLESSALGPYGVAGFAGSISSEIKDRHGGLEFPCPYGDCKKINKRPYGKLIRICGEGQIGGCGRDVTC